MLLEIEELIAGYGKTEVLHGVHLHVGAGEVVGLIGPNGAGKSTILNAIFGLATVTRGRIRFQDADILREPTHALLAKGLAYVPQGRLVFPSLTVEENLKMGGYTLRSRSAVNDRLEDLYEQFPALLELRRKRASDCSGGQQQLVAIGRALMVSPQLLLLDEPSLGLSPVACGEVYAALRRLRDAGTALLIVEQNVRLVLEIANRIICLANGAVRAEGPPADFRDPERMRTLYFGG
ncbi:ABC transporter ATP-binding protein [Candidatus Uhrbacteria bacterium]|nr:ABC transporter ATP-binding protein [Candidatus Uhrbacteria bacterium]